RRLAARLGRRALIPIFAGALVVLAGAAALYLRDGRTTSGARAQPARAPATSRRPIRAAAIARAAPDDDPSLDDEEADDAQAAAAATARQDDVGAASNPARSGSARHPGAHARRSDRTARQPAASAATPLSRPPDSNHGDQAEGSARATPPASAELLGDAPSQVSATALPPK